MKKIFVLLSLLIGFKSYAQNSDEALLRASYDFIHIVDTNFRDKPRTEKMLLVVGKNASVYTSYDKINLDATRRKMVEEQMKNQDGRTNMNINLSNPNFKPTTNIDYFSFANEGKFYVKERLMNNYLIEEPMPTFNWKIETDTASYGGLVCQKATANYKGRNWIAWFASDLPFSTGPWKLNGLPGLILQAYDDKKEVQFLFTGLEKVITTPNDKKEEETLGTRVIIMGAGSKTDYMGALITIPKDAIKTTRKEFEKLKQAQKDDPEGFMKTQMASMGMSGDFKMTRSTNTSNLKLPVMNNPIELPESK